ncbi:MAG: Nif3-like dinuclear metal center hexameric protein, partial [Spirochaetales bacterium]|nr:Nif3-like dinuclear metal center hexameric protein [Candidatus Physcosoma equi]
DLLITGEVSHQYYHMAMEAGLSVLAGGHYKTETFGVKALEKLTREDFGIETTFIDMETGL